MTATCHIAQRDTKVGTNTMMEDDNKVEKRNMDNVKGLEDMKQQNNHFNYNNNNDMQNHFHENRLVILVVSNAKNYDIREAQRKAFNQTFLENIGMKRVFLLFKPNNNDDDEEDDNDIKDRHQERIEEEQKRNFDIIQGDMEEGYRNLAYKHLMGLRWVAEQCNHFR